MNYAPSVTTDLNGQKMEYTYDALGRQMTIRAPYEIESGQPFTIRFEYFPSERKAHTGTVDLLWGGRLILLMKNLLKFRVAGY